jgi:hypothetical protein
VGAEEFTVKITYECSIHDNEVEELDLFDGFAFAVQIDHEGIEGHALGQKYPAVLYWLEETNVGNRLQIMVFADDDDDAAHLMHHVMDELTAESATENGHSDVEQVDAAEEEYHVGYEESIGPTDAELDAWLTERFGEDKQPLPGHKFNRPFARALIEFGRSFT